MGKLKTTADNVELKTNKITSSTPSTSWTAAKYLSAASVYGVYNNILNTYMPVGTLLETTDSSWTPNSKGMGTWELLESGVVCEHIGTQVIHPGLVSSGQVGKTNLCGCYHEMLFENLYTGLEKPGYHIELRQSFISYTESSRDIQLYLNMLKMNSANTWSHPNYRACNLSESIKLSDITKEPTLNYPTEGINLEYLTTATDNGNTYSWGFFDICIQAYLVSDAPIYKWKRVS